MWQVRRVWDGHGTELDATFWSPVWSHQVRGALNATFWPRVVTHWVRSAPTATLWGPVWSHWVRSELNGTCGRAA